MGSPYLILLDGYEFPRDDVPFRGPLDETMVRRWSKQDVLGSVQAPSIMTLLGYSSREWEFLSRASAATYTKLKAVYEAEAPVTIKTPQNPTTGFSVLMTEFSVVHDAPIERSRHLCRFVLVKR